MMARLRRTGALFLIALFLLMLNGFSMNLLRKNGFFIRFYPVDNIDMIYPANAIPSNSLAIFATEFTGTTPVALLTEVMNQVRAIDTFIAEDPLAIYRHAQAGGGLVCEGMAKLYHAVLVAHGFDARIVGLKRNLLGVYDTHTTVEVLVDGKWVIYDPTFHVSYQRNGELLGAQAIKESLYDGTYTAIHPIFYGDVRYPARLDSYYMNWLPLYNNVLVWAAPTDAFWSKLPPFRYWWSSRYYYQPLSAQQIQRHRFVNQLYFGVIVIMPSLCALILLYGTIDLLWLMFFRQRIFEKRRAISTATIGNA